MANIKVLGNSLTITSNIKTEDIKKVMNVAPDFCQLIETSELPPYHAEVIFAVGVTEGAGSITDSGICFDSTDKNGNAYLTLALTNRTEEMDEAYFAEQFMKPMVRLNDVELRIKEAIEYANKTIEAVTKDVKIIG